jgi:uncharacterized membrane protein
MRSVIVYTLARLLLVAATAAVLFLLGVGGLLNLALAVLISGVISYVVLSKQRDAISAAVYARTNRRGSAAGEGADGEVSFS